MPSTGGTGTISTQRDCNTNTVDYWALILDTQCAFSNCYLLKNLGTRLCLGPNSNTPPNAVAEYPCKSGDDNQDWIQISEGACAGGGFAFSNLREVDSMHPESDSNDTGAQTWVNAEANCYHAWMFGNSMTG
jgi:hypothetical protein